MVQISTVAIAFCAVAAVSAAPAKRPSILKKLMPNGGGLLATPGRRLNFPRPRPREFDEAELAEREPFLPLLFGAARIAKGVVGAVRGRRKRDLEFEDELALRELDDILVDAREFEDYDLYEREFSDVEEREIDELD
ncbi:hypothetical protein NLJ89_g1994 [Agrocybe chaxingu]|uniref:Uncharacterized protein n=1 Tax=Agrocybe chaxingu TaxID=84603 RepID=A0A9W8MZ00_9AGAR|nr:hypothetical protein NLJ89_g1994 [Agrocybe chaxingu]